MTARALVIAVRLVEDRFHGVDDRKRPTLADWPPSPFRLFQALVAGAYGGRWVAEDRAAKDAAFRWLEGLTPPRIAAPPANRGRSTAYFVPNNDLDAVDGDPRRVAEIRARKQVRPAFIDGDRPIVYVWPVAEGEEEHARTLARLADRLHTLGRGIDPAFATAEIVAAGEAAAQLAKAGATSIPTPFGGEGRDLLCPAPGSLASLAERHAAMVERFKVTRAGRSLTTLFRQPPKPQFRTICYDRPPTRFLYDLRPEQGERPFAPVPQERSAILAIAVRDLIAERLKGAFGDDRQPQIERLILGREAGPTDLPRRIRILPLPTIGHPNADPAIRRVIVEVPPDCPFRPDEIDWALAGEVLGVPGKDRVCPETGEVTTPWIIRPALLAPAADDSMLRHYGIEPSQGSEGRQSTEEQRERQQRDRSYRRWRTVTPAMLPRADRPHRRNGKERAEVDGGAAVAGLVVAALRHANAPASDIEVSVQREPFHLKGARAERFAPPSDMPGPVGLGVGKLRERLAQATLRHVEVILPRAVAGPLVIGDGRFLGLGLMMPMRDRRAHRPIISFKLDGDQGLPAAADRVALLRAVRRALLALARDKSGRIDRLFSGHEADGSPAASGKNEHVFLAATGEGGRLTHVHVIAPWRADREAPMPRGKARLFDAVVSTLGLVRAGPLGVLSLAIDPSEPESRPLFGRARRWTSATPYVTERRPRRHEDASAFAAANLAAAIRARGLPEPEIAIRSAIFDADRRVRVEAAVTFAKAVEGPLLLGHDSHFGGGLFCAFG